EARISPPPARLRSAAKTAPVALPLALSRHWVELSLSIAIAASLNAKRKPFVTASFFSALASKTDLAALLCRPSCLLRFRRVVTLTINRRHLPAHRPQIRRQLASVVNLMMHVERQIRDRRQLNESLEIDDLHQLFRRHRLNRRHILRKCLVVPAR